MIVDLSPNSQMDRARIWGLNRMAWGYIDAGVDAGGFYGYLDV